MVEKYRMIYGYGPSWYGSSGDLEIRAEQEQLHIYDAKTEKRLGTVSQLNREFVE